VGTALNHDSDRFLFITDLHLAGGTDRGWATFDRFVRDVRRMSPPPAFVICGGDIASASMALTTPAAELRRILDRYKEALAGLPCPAFHAVGNHDLADSGRGSPDGSYGKEVFESVLGPRFQSFDWRDYHVVILDVWRCHAVGVPGYRVGMDVDDEQVAWLEADLRRCRSGQTVILVDHHQLRDLPGEPRSGHRTLSVLGADQVRDVLRDDLDYVEVSGCDHQNGAWRSGRWTTYTTASFCGAWWRRETCIDGGRSGYALFVDDHGALRHYCCAHGAEVAIREHYSLRVWPPDAAVNVIDPYTGAAAETPTGVPAGGGGYVSLPLATGDKHTVVDLFVEPSLSEPGVRPVSGTFSFCLAGDVPEAVPVMCNQCVAGELPTGARAGERIAIPVCNGLFAGWNRLEFRGGVLLIAPVLEVAGKRYADPRLSRLIQARKGTPCEAHAPVWDTSETGPSSPWQYQVPVFYFQVDAQG